MLIAIAISTRFCKKLIPLGSGAHKAIAVAERIGDQNVLKTCESPQLPEFAILTTPKVKIYTQYTDTNVSDAVFKAVKIGISTLETPEPTTAPPWSLQGSPTIRPINLDDKSVESLTSKSGKSTVPAIATAF